MKYLAVLACVLMASVAVNGLYMLKGSPEIAFARKVVAEQNRQLVATETEKQIIFVGGSSCSFSVDPVLMREEFGLAACNLGLPAGTGRGLHIERALQEVGKGDVLVLAFEMTGWTGEEGEWITPLGSQFWYGAVGKKYDFTSDVGEELQIPDHYQLAEMRPGGKHTMTMAMKLALRQPLFRYQESVIRVGGYLCMDRGYPLSPRNNVAEYNLDSEIAEVLRLLVDEMNGRGAQVCVSLPWYFTSESIAEAQRHANKQLIEEISAICPVLEDQQLGVETDKMLFADTNWHLSRSGAEKRTRVIGREVKRLMQ